MNPDRGRLCPGSEGVDLALTRDGGATARLLGEGSGFVLELPSWREAWAMLRAVPPGARRLAARSAHMTVRVGPREVGSIGPGVRANWVGRLLRLENAVVRPWARSRR